MVEDTKENMKEGGRKRRYEGKIQEKRERRNVGKEGEKR